MVPAIGFSPFEAEPPLGDIYDAIELSCSPTDKWSSDDEWTNLANWSFHQALWSLAERTKSTKNIHREEVTFEMFDERMRVNLSDESWSAERVEYADSPELFQ